MNQIVVDGTVIETNNRLREGCRIHGRGTVTKEHAALRPRKEMCSGCEDNFYNGNNDLGVKECWSFRAAKVVNKVGYSSIHCCNGPDTIMRKTLSCWHAVSK